MAWNWDVFWQVASSSLLPYAAWTTLWVAVVAQTIGTLLGIVFAPMSMSRHPLAWGTAWLYSWIFRGTPLLVQILFFYAVLPRLGLQLGVYATGLVALGLNEGARMAEIVRAGLMSVDHGQREAARSLGLRPLPVFGLIVLPQAIRLIVPPLGNNFNYMLKATSLLSVISFTELMRTSQQLAQATTRPLEIYCLAAIYYLVLTTLWTLIQARIEARLATPARTATGDQAQAATPLAERAAQIADPIVSVRGLTKSFGGRRALDSVDLTIGRGEVIVVVGPSGCGKSTLLRCLNRLDSADAGSITFDGVSVDYGNRAATREAEVNRWRRDIGMVFQRFNLFPHLCALENVMLAPCRALGRSRAEVEPEARALLARVGLAEHAAAYPTRLSGGQQQRVAIARALAMKPKLMMFDEPTSALDPETVNDVLDAMRDLVADGMTMIVVTHEMGFARQVADRVLFMDHGRIVEEGTPGQFFDGARHPRSRAFLAKILRQEVGA
jgi:polar amino acid transport system permease protein